MLSRGDGIVSAVVIDGDSLNDTATKIGGMTGENGSKIINVTRPDAHGTKVAITAALYDNASATASIDTIFTVVTSPNSDKAKMWGHMPETTTAANGVVFKRPLLSAEIASGFTHGDNTENNEARESSILKWRTTPVARDTYRHLPICNRCTTPGPAAP